MFQPEIIIGILFFAFLAVQLVRRLRGLRNDWPEDGTMCTPSNDDDLSEDA